MCCNYNHRRKSWDKFELSMLLHKCQMLVQLHLPNLYPTPPDQYLKFLPRLVSTLYWVKGATATCFYRDSSALFNFSCKTQIQYCAKVMQTNFDEIPGFSKKFRLKRYFDEISPHFRDTFCFDPRDFSNDSSLRAMIHRKFSNNNSLLPKSRWDFSNDNSLVPKI